MLQDLLLDLKLQELVEMVLLIQLQVHLLQEVVEVVAVLLMHQEELTQVMLPVVDLVVVVMEQTPEKTELLVQQI